MPIFGAGAADEKPSAQASEMTSVVSSGPLRTDRVAYTARRVRGFGKHREYAVTLIAQYTNRSAAPVYLNRCFPDSPQPIYNVHLIGAREPLESGYDPGWACVGHDNPIVVQPGAIRVDTLRITGPNTWEGDSGEPIGKLEGRYRLEYEAQSGPQEVAPLLPDSMRLSNEFDIRTGR